MSAPTDTATSAVYRLDDLCCPSEGVRIEAALTQSDDAQDWSINYLDGTVRVRLRSPASVPRVQDVLERTGFGVTRVDAADGAPSDPSPPARRGLLGAWVVALGAVLSGVVLASLGRDALAGPFYLVAVACGGLPIARRAWRSLRSRALDMHVLMTVAVIGAVAVGEWFEAAVVVLLFALANALEAFSLERARRAIDRLLEFTPRYATVRRDGETAQVPVEAVGVGDVVVVKAGERLPVDGVVVVGRSDVDQAAITGESRLVAKSVGDTVFAGAFCADGLLEVRATHAAMDSMPARIRHLVEEAQASKAPVQRYVDRFAARYTPAVLVCAALVAVVPPLLLGASWSAWVYEALVLLVIACPCALVISTPVTLVSHLAAAARRGILIKGGAHLENLARVCSVVFDKTGTLTRGEPQVAHVEPLNGYSEAEVLGYAAAVEQFGSHPLAPIICAAARAADVPIPSAAPPHTHPGQGVHATVNDQDVWVGTLAMASGEGPLLDAAAAEVQKHEAHGETAVVVGSGTEPFGVIAFVDTPRAEAGPTIARLRAQGLHHLYMLTGDNRSVADELAATMGLDAAYAELLPEDKVAVVRELLQDEHQVAMVGDGVNDAPALVVATVGIAMGAGGTDVAIETADVALIGDDLTALPRAIQVARSAMRIVRQNIAIALGLKLLVFGLALAGIATLWMAILADMGASMIVIANALRPLARARA